MRACGMMSVVAMFISVAAFGLSLTQGENIHLWEALALSGLFALWAILFAIWERKP
jgi:hypothetical protein